MGVTICGCYKFDPQVIKNLASLKPKPNFSENPENNENLRENLEIASKQHTFLNTEQNELEEILQKKAFQIKPLRNFEKNIDFGDLNQAKVHLIKAFRKNGKKVISLHSEISYEIEKRQRISIKNDQDQAISP